MSNQHSTRTVTTFKTPVGLLTVEYDDHYIFRSFFSESPVANTTESPGLKQIIENELANYFSHPRHRFQLPLKPEGTNYQQKVWNALLAIPVGRTVTYGELAHSLQSSPRAIGQACKNNPLALFIPCHRVVGKDNPGGYMGKAKALIFKEQLLVHEGCSNHY